MPCMAQSGCRIKSVYIGPRGHYHGELCGGCMFWEDSPEDLEFKVKEGIIKEVKETIETPDWF